ncbi:MULTISPECIES: GNAT family N-acetyltransferase [Streptococcus]|uniref:GNAT family N-acetyltransferase n=1 Tax=Streptococcus caledonicus TaxID=2614158 RepID=A0ABW0UG46_9STRE|nr:GNAT family protein [Streptococcus sp. S784/96/1]
MKPIGTQTIKTNRLILRRWRLEDAKAMFQNWASDVENTQYVPWETHQTLADTEEFLTERVKDYSSGEVFRWAITLHDNPTVVIGDISVVSIRTNVNEAEIGYILSKQYWNQGVMTEALAAVIDFLFDQADFDRIVAGFLAENIASGRVIEKAGMSYEGTFRQAMKVKGKIYDYICYGLLKSDWLAD